MRAAAFVRAGLAGGLVLLAGCLLTTSLEGLSGPALHDAGASDADPPATTTDGGPDGPEPDATADGGPFCASHRPPPLFCVDFDDGRLDDLFSLVRRTGGNVRLDDSMSVSAPTSMLSEIDAPNGCRYADAIKTLPVGLREIHYEFRVFLPQTASDVAIASLQHMLPSGEKACHYILALAQPDNLNVQRIVDDQTINDNRPLVRSIPRGRWTRISIDVVEKAAVPNVSVRIDGEVVLPELALPECGLGGEVSIFAGLYCTGGKRTANYDDIKLDGK